MGLILNGCGGDDHDYDDEYIMLHDDDGGGGGGANDDDDVPFFKTVIRQLVNTFIRLFMHMLT